ncbi:MAG TPA: heparinase II/III family protein [Gemmatimonadaceae bacterium]
MTLLLDDALLARRREVARDAGALAPLAASLRRELQPLLDAGVEVPRVKAMLTRDGGRCPRHGVPLAFDPWRPRQHRCPVCGEIWRGERHDLWWVMGYQLWLAERAARAAVLHALLGEPVLAALSLAILDAYAERYLDYPNRDNVLGPTRPFFSTYLESIWLLQLAVALDLLETSGAAGSAGARVRERILRPSADLIASYDEGGSNRQVWNDAALLAAGLLLDDRRLVTRAVLGESGLLGQLSGGLLPDGTWYEGENYHLFAHRGLWYGVTMAERAGIDLPSPLVARFAEGFATPLATALPDLTFPSRRDSQYAVSLRQWRFAESCELGLARGDDPRLAGALRVLYAGDIPKRDTGRWRSTAEAERNEPATALDRADLGWRSLLLARETLPPLEPYAPRSTVLEGQGLAVLRRERGRVYAALDYGHSGGGHGHPDRLGLLLVRGADRWLDDMGTGSYVDPTLHWYRSTLAHNAPLVDGRSQRRANGVLRAWDERGGVGWVDAEVPRGGIAPGVRVRRSVVVMPAYLVDRVEWEADRPVRFELPIHVTGTLHGPSAFHAAALDGGEALEDGFPFAHDAEVAGSEAGAVVRLDRGGAPAAWITADAATEWWRAVAPGAPGSGECEFLLVRAHGRGGTIVSVWSWAGEVADVLSRDGAIVVDTASGARHEHAPTESTWRIALAEAGGRSGIELAGTRATFAPATVDDESDSRVEPELIPVAPAAPLHIELGEGAYRMSEERWLDAGAPTAVVSVRVEERDLVVDVEVVKSPVVFRAADAPDPALDNEHPDIHSDGVQLHLAAPAWTHPAAWLAVPEPPGGPMRVRLVDGARADIPLRATWRPTGAGWAARLRVPVDALGDCRENPLGLQVVINDMAPGRRRRRGQLALGGAGGHVYLRGDRESPADFLHFLLPRV